MINRGHGAVHATSAPCSASRRYAHYTRPVGPLATYRRGRVLVRLGDTAAVATLAAFVRAFPTDSAAPGALYVLADMFDSRDDWANADWWYAALIARITQATA